MSDRRYCSMLALATATTVKNKYVTPGKTYIGYTWKAPAGNIVFSFKGDSGITKTMSIKNFKLIRILKGMK